MSTSSDKQLFWDNPHYTALYKQADKFTGTFAKLMLEQAGFAEDAKTLEKLIVLDTACGPGIVSNYVVQALDNNAEALGTDPRDKLDLTCADFFDSMVDITSKRIKADGWPAKAIKADAQDTGLPDGKYTHVFCNVSPMHIPVLGLT